MVGRWRRRRLGRSRRFRCRIWVWRRNSVRGGAPGLLPRIGIWMRLEELAAEVEVARIVGDGPVRVVGLAYDSRRVAPGTLFFCFPGEKADGHDFAIRAVEAGA